MVELQVYERLSSPRSLSAGADSSSLSLTFSARTPFIALERAHAHSQSPPQAVCLQVGSTRADFLRTFPLWLARAQDGPPTGATLGDTVGRDPRTDAATEDRLPGVSDHKGWREERETKLWKSC
jgi:hypothetical protein